MSWLQISGRGSDIMESFSDQTGTTPVNYDERRVHQRKDVRVNKVFSADITMGGEEHKCRLYVADVSEGGFKITSDYPFVRNVPIIVTMHLKVPFTFTAEIAWGRDLGAGMNALGLRFLEMEPDQKKVLDGFIEYYTSKEKAKVFRLNKIIPMRIKRGESFPEPFYVLTIEISLMGMKISHDTRLPEGEVIEFKLYLDPHTKPLEVKAHVVSQKEEGMLGENYIINLEYIDLSCEAREYLTSFIDNAMSGIIEKKISRPVVMFDEDSST